MCKKVEFLQNIDIGDGCHNYNVKALYSIDDVFMMCFDIFNNHANTSYCSTVLIAR